ncbi:MAG: xanthine dehydrogenase family protein subunit M [Planctomycetaceae bacterium]|nr:xanthine dehydrogenase family protein subunit M [Planctomycetaceae bacterium]
MRQYRFHAPTTFEELFRILDAEKGAEVKYLAGGTDLVPRISRERETIPNGDKPPVVLVSLAGLGLAGVEERDGEVRIGAMTTLSDLQTNPIVKAKLPALSAAVDHMAGFSIRNTATLGGNIMNASPAADSLPPLMVLDATFVLRGRGGERCVMAADFFTGPGSTAAKPDEILVAIAVKAGKGAAAFHKLGRRAAETLSVVNAAAYVEVENGVFKTARVAVGSAAPTVRACRKTAQALEGKPVTAESARTAAALVVDEIAPITDIRASDWYRRKVAPVVAARAILAAAGIQDEGR